jgi:hypothetical protein
MPPRTQSRRAAIVARSCWCRSFFPSCRKALPTLRGRFGSPSRFCSRSWHFSVHPTCRGCRRGSRKSVSGKVNSRGHGRVQTWRQQRSRQVVASHSAIPAARSPPGRRRVRQQERDWRGQHVRRVAAGALRRRSRAREERQRRASLHRDEPVSSQHAGLAPSGCHSPSLARSCTRHSLPRFPRCGPCDVSA